MPQVWRTVGALLHPTSRISKSRWSACVWARPCWSWKVGRGAGSGKLMGAQPFQHCPSVQISGYEDYTEPLLAHCREMKEKHPNLPLFLVGHSMGGLISLISVLEAQVLMNQCTNRTSYFSPGCFCRLSPHGSTHPPGSQNGRKLHGEPTQLERFCFRKVENIS